MIGDLSTVILVSAVVAWAGLGAVSASHSVMSKRDPRGAALWVIVSFTLPILGPWLYWGFGINRVHRRAIKRLGWRGRSFRAADHAPSTEAVDSIDSVLGHLKGLDVVGRRLTDMPLAPGNLVEALHNGEEAYPAMLEAIGSARRSVTLGSYIFDWDEIGRRFTEALGEAAGRGVRVHVLLDGLGAVKAFSRVGRRLIRSGAEVSAFFPLRFPLGRFRLNLRNHRKIVVVDGSTGFTGGMNISRKHLAGRAAADRIEDVHFRIRGPVVGQIQQAFAEDWFLATDEILSGPAYYPELSAAGSAWCRGISSGPDEHIGATHRIIHAAIAAAKREVTMVTPYFIPSRTLIETMGIAAMGGVEVRVLLPSQVDHRFMGWAADAFLWQLLENGVRVYRQPPPFVHTKLMIVDRRWVLLGSANVDPRSLRLNFEFNVEAYDGALAEGLSKWLDERIGRCVVETLAKVDGRSRGVRVRDGFVKMFSPYL